MNRSIYRAELSALEQQARSLPVNKFSLFGLVNALSLLILSWEKNMVNRNLDDHPYTLANELIRKTKENLQILGDVNKIAYDNGAQNIINQENMEDYHKELFQNLWIKFSEEDYKKRVEQYVYRLKINKVGPFIKGKKCIDFGCGHGNFANALLEVGASYVLGIDYGKDSISYCRKATERLKNRNIEFDLKTVYDTGMEDGSFDFAVQNGVFHHVDNEDRAYGEVYRVLKPGAWFWVYTDGENSIQSEIQDSAARILSKYSFFEVSKILDTMGLSIGKRYHIGDSLQATYRHSNLEDMVTRLEGYGFGNYRRLFGGYSTDSDGDAKKDPWALEKFGSGDVRLLVQKI